MDVLLSLVFRQSSLHRVCMTKKLKRTLKLCCSNANAVAEYAVILAEQASKVRLFNLAFSKENIATVPVFLANPLEGI